ncbi:MAG: hypothetical protein GX142_08720 [Chloroflexi bacterium]|jgi:hypothetical protein|nr:hypothetical protein [Chloroflexota bacterium]
MQHDRLSTLNETTNETIRLALWEDAWIKYHLTSHRAWSCPFIGLLTVGMMLRVILLLMYGKFTLLTIGKFINYFVIDAVISKFINQKRQ